MKKKNTVVTLILFIAIVITVNVLSEKYSFRRDITDDKIFTLSESTRKILLSLDEPVTIKAYFSDNLPADVQKAKNDVQDLLVEYARLSKGKIVFTFINPGQSEDLEQEAMQQGVEPVLINVREKDEMKQQKAYIGVVVSTQTSDDAIPVIKPGSAIEYLLTTSIKKVTVKEKPYVGLIVGHGEPTVDQLIQANQALSVLYHFQAVRLDSSSTEIPEQFKTIAIVRPKDSIPNEHFKLLDDFVNRGGKVLVAINRVDGNFQDLVGYGISTGLETWLKSYGIDVDEYFVADALCGTVTLQQSQGTYQYNTQVNFPFLPLSHSFSEHPVSDGLEATYFAFVSPVRFIGDSSQYKSTAIISSSDKSSLFRAPIRFEINKQWAQQDFPYKSIPLAQAIEKKNGEPFMVVFGDGDFVINGPRGEAQEQMPDNINVFVNAIDWLSDETGLMELRTRGTTARPIDIIDDSTKSLIKIANVALPILLALLVGVFRSYRKKVQRYKRMEERYE